MSCRTGSGKMQEDPTINNVKIVEQDEEIVELEIQNQIPNLGTLQIDDPLTSEPVKPDLEEVRQECTRIDVSIERKWAKNHTYDLIIEDPNVRVRIRSATQNEYFYMSFLSQMEPKYIDEALQDFNRIEAMQEELN